MNSPKLGIVIPLKSKTTSRNWNTTTEALRLTLNSVLNQTDSRFEIAIAGHEKPQLLSEKKFADVTFGSIDTVPPSLSHPSQFKENKSPFIIDKNQKIVRAMQLLQKTRPTMWFYLDADDLLSTHFVSRVLKPDCQYGAVVDNGYFLYRRQWRKRQIKNLSAYCGSTSILSDKDCEVPKTLEPTCLDSVPWCRYPHSEMHAYFNSRAVQIYQIIQEPIIAYVIGHGDNCSDGYRQNLFTKIKTGVKPWLLGSPLNKNFEFEFGITA